MDEIVLKILVVHSNQTEMFCGEPKKGIHSTRLFGLAFWDLALTALAAAIVRRYLMANTGYLWVFLLLMVTGLLVHKTLGIETTLTRLVFG